MTLTFKVGKNMDAALQDVRSSLASIEGMLPKEIASPIISKANTNAMPILL